VEGSWLRRGEPALSSPRTHKTNKQAEHHRIPGRKWLQRRTEGELLSVVALCFHTLIKSNVGNTDAKPGEEASYGGHIREPGENSS